MTGRRRKRLRSRACLLFATLGPARKRSPTLLGPKTKSTRKVANFAALFGRLVAFGRALDKARLTKLPRTSIEDGGRDVSAVRLKLSKPCWEPAGHRLQRTLIAQLRPNKSNNAMIGTTEAERWTRRPGNSVAARRDPIGNGLGAGSSNGRNARATIVKGPPCVCCPSWEGGPPQPPSTFTRRARCPHAVDRRHPRAAHRRAKSR